ncbi:MAG: nickel pincer cofactor biosynthesis protein LarC [Halanaerobiales bacterium]
MMDAYFDMFSGISGNMVLGALLDLGLELEELEDELEKLGLSSEYKIITKRVTKEGISGTYVNVQLLDEHNHHNHEGGHTRHHGRNLNDINQIIDNSALSEGVKEKSKNIFLNLARAEAKIHGTEIEEIHFHEVGAVDAIVDIVGSVIGLELLGIKRIFASRIHTGTGFVNCQHGKMPLPAPATMELLSGVPIYSNGIKSELVTPTGAAIITTLAEEFGPRPEMEVERTGYGAGSRDLEIPNLLRINMGKISGSYSSGSNRLQDNLKKKFNLDKVTILETNIDDMNPEYYQHIIEKLLSIGALDVYLTPIQMKKNRPAVKLSVLIDSIGQDDNSGQYDSDKSGVSKSDGQNILENILEIIFKESSSLGVRVFQDINRYSLNREVEEIETPWGSVRIKRAYLDGDLVNSNPEYEDCKKIADFYDLPIKEVYEYVMKKIGV